MAPTPEQTASADGVALMGPDERRWQRLWVGPQSAGVLNIYRVRIGTKVVEAVPQTEAMIIYVNPEAEGADEWEMPQGSGVRLMVLSPQGMPRTGPPQGRAARLARG